MAGQPYVTRLPGGGYLAVELPEGSAEIDSVTGEVILQPPAIHLLDRLRVVLSPLPTNTTPARLRILRETLGLSREDLAARLQVEATQIEGWESGQDRPGPQNLAALEQLRQRSVRTGVVLPERVLAS